MSVEQTTKYSYKKYKIIVHCKSATYILYYTQIWHKHMETRAKWCTPNAVMHIN